MESGDILANNSNRNTNLKGKIHRLTKISKIIGNLSFGLSISLLFLIARLIFVKNHTLLTYPSVFDDLIIPVIVFIFIYFTAFNIFLIYNSNQLVKNYPSQTNEYLNLIRIISILIIIISLPSLIYSFVTTIIIIPYLGIIINTCQIKKSLKTVSDKINP